MVKPAFVYEVASV